jgi:hypothetical protein
MNDKNLQLKDEADAQQGNTVSMFERLAKDPNVSVEKLKGLMDLQERADARNAKAVFAQAFAVMQGEIPVVTKNGEIKVNNEVRSRFARFEDIDKIIKPILQKHGFAITHKTKFDGGLVKVISVLMHSAGHTEETEFVSASDKSGGKNDIQALASATSYGKRQNTKALLNIAEGGEDDDGNKGGAGPVITTEQACLINDMIGEAATTPAKFLAYLNTEHKLALQTVEDIPAKVYPDALASLKGAISAHKRKTAPKS